LNHVVIEGLGASHGAAAVLHQVDLTIAAGQVTVIAGPNGCGKSTLLRCIARLHRPSAGTVKIGGDDVWRMRGRDAARRLALLPQTPIAPDGITVAELVRYGRHPHQGLFRQWSQDDERAMHAAMSETGTLPMAGRRMDQLSGGQRQRCWLAMVLAQETPLVLLDEPTSMLDLGHQIEVLELVRALARAGRSIVMVLHDLAAAARYADTLVAMKGGSIVACGSPRKIVTSALVRTLYGVEADIVISPGDGAPVVMPRAGHGANLKTA
jgi:iron complex transport system ATP-binding protein